MIYEMRTYTYCAGELPVIMDSWRDCRLECQENKILMPSSFSPLQ